ncbi:CotH kinase family protein [Bacteroidota bacterium]
MLGRANRIKYSFRRALIFFYFFIAAISVGYAQNIFINEVQSSNMSTIYDHTGDTPDWIEIYNGGVSSINLENYGISDVDSLPLKWTFPPTILAPQGHLLVYASGLDLKEPSLYWETIIDIGDEWKYLVPTSELASSWRDVGYDDSDWSTGKSGFGYGDEDDSTILDVTLSVFIRKRITINDKNDIQQAYLHIDFDDGFVAYLNGIEIARSNIGTAGIPPAFDQPADNYNHEAAMYQGSLPDKFLIDSVYNYLVEGENILAIQIHNHSLSSSDLTAIPFFTVGKVTNPGSPLYISPYINLVPIGLHTNFKISSAGEHLVLSDLTGQRLDSVYTAKIPADISLGRKPDGSNSWMFFAEPTPDLPNTTEGWSTTPVPSVQFSMLGGFYQSSMNLELSTTNPSDSIFYTIDGSEPDKTDSLYSSEIVLSKTTTIRARVIWSGHLPGEIGTNTYLINEPHDLPVVSVNTDPLNLWDEDYGIYVMGKNASVDYPYMGANFWEDWERPANIAMYEPNGTLAFQLDAGIKIFGNWSRGQAQKSLSIHTRKSYGYDGIYYKIFNEKDLSEFKTIVLRNSGNDFNNTMLRDAYANRILTSLNLDHQAYRPAVVYINGEYWGIQNIREKVNEEFIHFNHGIKESLIDILEFNGSVVKGNPEHYNALLEYLSSRNLANGDHYNYVSKQIDIENYIKYLVGNIFIDNQDWPGNNTKYWRERSAYGKWRWIVFDLDAAFSAWFEDNKTFNTLEFALDPDGPGWPNPPWSTFLFRKMMENQSFKYDFINCFADNLNTIFKPAILEGHLNEMKSVIEPEIQNHLIRWDGGNIDNWEYNIFKIRDFVRSRWRYVRDHIRSEFNLSGTFEISLNTKGNGQIKVNTITLNSFPWSGLYFNDIPVKIEAIPDPGYKFFEWQGIETYDREHLRLNAHSTTAITAVFVTSEEVADEVIINEINYNSSADFDAGDWVELYNVSDHGINVSGWVIKDDNDEHEFVFPSSTIIDSRGFLVVCENKDRFLGLFPFVKSVEGEMDFGFSSGGECIRLFTANEMLMDWVCYENDYPWPAEPNGTGASLALKYSIKNNEDPANWESSISHGTPGAKNLDIMTDLQDQIDENNTLADIIIYPNPTKGTITIFIQSARKEDMSFMLTDLTGKTYSKVLKYSLSQGKNELNLDLREFRRGLFSGVYILHIESKSTSKRLKIIIQ